MNTFFRSRPGLPRRIHRFPVAGWLVGLALIAAGCSSVPEENVHPVDPTEVRSATSATASTGATTSPATLRPGPSTTKARATTTTTRVVDGLEPGELVVIDGQLVDRNGPLQLRGVNRSGTEYACAQGWGLHDVHDQDVSGTLQALLDQMVEWEINTVRVPLNEHCWLGRNGVSERWGGEAYRSGIGELVDDLHARGLIVVLALMWADAGDTLALRQPEMANRDHSLDFWESVAGTFAGRGRMIFDLYGEPHLRGDWACWRDGCDFDGYPAAGMQELLDTVRATGAREPVIVSGLRFANDLSEWSAHAPVDPLGQIIAGFHLYNFNACIDPECWEREVAPILAEVPVLTSELGENRCDGSFVGPYLEWADARDIGYLGWAFNSEDSCEGGPGLLADNVGTATAYGVAFRDHLRLRAAAETER